MDNIWRSPNFRPEKLFSGLLEDKIDVFEDDLRVAIIDQAVALFNPSNPGCRHAGKAVLMILLPYFETIAQYRKGSDSALQSKAMFKEEFLRVFPLVNTADPSLAVPGHVAAEIAEAIYTQVRCGLLHSSSTKSKVMLSNRWSEPIRIATNGASVELIEVHPEQFLKKVSEELFPAYLAELRDPSNVDLRTKFAQFFDAQG